MMNNNPVQKTESNQIKVQSFSFIIAVSFCILFSVFLVWSDFLRDSAVCEIKLESRINPNSATVASLLRLPGVGISRAEAIAAYRREFTRLGNEGPAFKNCDDLKKIKGIGPKTVENIKEWLKFE